MEELIGILKFLLYGAAIYYSIAFLFGFALTGFVFYRFYREHKRGLKNPPPGFGRRMPRRK